MSRFHHSQHYAVFFVTLLFAGVIVAYPLFDYDLYWHLANGREMLAGRCGGVGTSPQT